MASWASLDTSGRLHRSPEALALRGEGYESAEEGLHKREVLPVISCEGAPSVKGTGSP
jgi:hypothetical protein